MFVALHKGKDALEQAKADCDAEMATIGPLGARHLVILPEGYTDFEGNLIGSPTLTDDEWTALTSGMSELGRYVADAYGAVLVFHTHADSHVGTQAEIERFLDRTDPEAVHLCLDTGHVAYCGADNLAPHPRLPGRGSATSTSSRSTRRSGTRRDDERLGFAPAVRLGVDGRAAARRAGHAGRRSRRSAALDRELFCIVEQDLYPCDPTCRCRSPPARASTSRHAGSTSGGRPDAAARVEGVA